MNEKAFPEKNYGIVRWPVVVLGCIAVLLYSLGIYSIIRYFILNPTALALIGFFLSSIGDLIARNLQIVTYLFTALVAVTIVSVPIILWAMAKFGRRVMIFVIFAIPVFIMALGLFMAVMGVLLGTSLISLSGLPFLLIGGVLLFFLYRRRERVYLAGRIFEMSAEAVATEKETLVPSLLFGLFSLFNVIMGVASGFLVFELLTPMQNGIAMAVSVFLVELGYAWLLFSFMYLADGTIIGIIDDWYRNPTADKANLKKGFSRAGQMAGPIIQFGFVMALLSTLARTARRKAAGARREGNLGGIIGAILLALLASLAYGLVQFVTYFTLPAIVVDGKGFKDSIKRSYTLIWRQWVDVLIAYLGIESTYAFFMLAMLALYGTVGAFVGWLLIAPTLTTTVPAILVSVLTAVAFIMFGFIPAYFLFRPMKAAYNTILYDFAKDMETGGQLPSRMPPDLKQQFQGIVAQVQTASTFNRWSEPAFLEQGPVGKIREELKEAKAEGPIKYAKGELIGEEVKTETRPMDQFCEHIQQIGINATLLKSGIPSITTEPCIKIEGRNINFVQIRSMPTTTNGSTSESGCRYDYVVQTVIKGSEDKLKSEIDPPTHWKLDLIQKRIVDFKWEGGELAQQLNADSDLKNMLLRGGLDKLVIAPDERQQLVRMIHMPGIWKAITVGSVTLPVGRNALLTHEDFETYDKIAQHIRSLASART